MTGKDTQNRYTEMTTEMKQAPTDRRRQIGTDRGTKHTGMGNATWTWRNLDFAR